MGFPDCGSSYFLLMQLDKSFKFVFQLLETQPEQLETSKTFDIVRCKKIDVDNMLMLEDEMNLSILDLRKMAAFLPIVGRTNQASSLLSELTQKGLVSVTVPPSCFSSLIDEVFEGEKGSLTSKHEGSFQMPHFNPSPTCSSGPRTLMSGGNVSVSRSSSNGLVGATGVNGSDSLSATPCPATMSDDDKNPRKRKVSDMLNSLPSLGGLLADVEVSKKRKLLAGQPLALSAVSSNSMRNAERLSYGDLLAEANRGNAPSGVYISALLHVIRHCTLCIKHARLTIQMDALDIPYFEETGPRASFLHIWVKIPSIQGDSWPYVCLRLGKPGKLCWDVKITDKHFRDLWDLQNGESDTSWGSGVRIANTSDVDSHISYDCEGVTLSYQAVEADSIKKLVADIHRLYNARMFARSVQVHGCPPADISQGRLKLVADNVQGALHLCLQGFRDTVAGLS